MLIVKKLRNHILSIIVIATITAALFEMVIAISFNYPTVWAYSPNKFFHQKLYRSQRNIIQYMDECAEYHPRLGYSNKIGKCNFSNKEFKTTVLFGEAGRLPEMDTNKPDKLCSAFFLGDSHTFGWGVEQEETFSHLVASTLDCEAHNYGVSSYGTARQVIDYNLRSSKNLVDPSYIFIQYSDNDLNENVTFLNNEGYLPTMSRMVYRNAQTKYVNKQRYFPFKYGFIVTKRVFNRSLKALFQSDKCSSCLAENPTDRSASAEATAFRYAISKLDHTVPSTQVIVFQINGSNRGQCNLVDEIAELGTDFLQTKNGADIEVVQVCNSLSDSDFFILDDHMNASGHNTTAKALLSHIGK